MSSQSLTASDINGGFALVGSLCFPARAGDTVEIQAKASAEGGEDQLLLFFDDQEGSFDSFGTSEGTCLDKVNLARPVCQDGDVHCQPGWKLAPGKAQKYTITINEETARQWYFVVSNCEDDKSVAGKPIEQPVRIESISITSSKGIPCSELHSGDGGVAAAIGIGFLVVLLIVFIGTSYIYYRKSRGLPPIPGGGRRDGGLLSGSGAGLRYSGRNDAVQDNDLSAPKTGHDDL